MTLREEKDVLAILLTGLGIAMLLMVLGCALPNSYVTMSKTCAESCQRYAGWFYDGFPNNDRALCKCLGEEENSATITIPNSDGSVPNFQLHSEHHYGPATAGPHRDLGR